MNIATALIGQRKRVKNRHRTLLLKKILQHLPRSVDILLLPAGYYSTYENAKSLYTYVQGCCMKLLKRYAPQCTIVLGIDGRKHQDQIAIAINRKGIAGMARKFYAVKGEIIKPAKDYLNGEAGYKRIFRLKGKDIYMAVCYDSFGIRHEETKSPGVDIILNLIHEFLPQGRMKSGDVYFIKHGMAGASKQWACPVFGSTVFIRREIPKNWQPGVLWNQRSMSTQKWRYKHNPLKSRKGFKAETIREKAEISLFLREK